MDDKMRLFIQIRNGEPYEHPILEDNFVLAFPDIDLNNLPENFARFERVPCDIDLDIYEVAEVSYQFINGIVKDVWSKRPMTNEERIQKDEMLITYTRSLSEGAFRDTTVSGVTPNVII